MCTHTHVNILSNNTHLEARRSSYLSDGVHAVIGLQDLTQAGKVLFTFLIRLTQTCVFTHTHTHTWEIRFSQPILLRPAAARMMAAKSSLSSSFFKRVLRFPRWDRAFRRTRGGVGLRRVLPAGTRPFKGYDVFEVQVWEPLLQLSGPTQRAGADGATQTRSSESRGHGRLGGRLRPYLSAGRLSRVFPAFFGCSTTASWGFSLLREQEKERYRREIFRLFFPEGKAQRWLTSGRLRW